MTDKLNARARRRRARTLTAPALTRGDDDGRRSVRGGVLRQRVRARPVARRATGLFSLKQIGKPYSKIIAPAVDFIFETQGIYAAVPTVPLNIQSNRYGKNVHWILRV